VIEANGLDAAIELQSIGYTLQLRELYKKVLAHKEERPQS
jgi:hypothetical protein